MKTKQRKKLNQSGAYSQRNRKRCSKREKEDYCCNESRRVSHLLELPHGADEKASPSQ
jgi:hypothetical protein